MNVRLKGSGRVIGKWQERVSIGDGIPLPAELRLPAYSYNGNLRWRPLGPRPKPQGIRVAVPFWCDRNETGEMEMVVDEGDEALFRTHQLFQASTQGE